MAPISGQRSAGAQDPLGGAVELGVAEREAGFYEPAWQHPLAADDDARELPERDPQRGLRRGEQGRPVRGPGEGLDDVLLPGRVGRGKVDRTRDVVREQELDRGDLVLESDPRPPLLAT